MKQTNEGKATISKPVIAILIVLLIVVGMYLYFASRPEHAVEEHKYVLIYDSLYREYPNQTLIDSLKEMFESHGYIVDIYLGKNATLDPLKHMERYDIIILRAHGAYNGDPKSRRPLGPYVYTGLHYDEAVELYGKNYVDRLIRDGTFALAVIPPPGYHGDYNDLPKYIALSPKYFDGKVKALKPGSIVIFTGCYGLTDERLASIFLKKGALAYMAWTGNVTWIQADITLEEAVKILLDGVPPGSIPSRLPDYARRDVLTGSTFNVVLQEGSTSS